MPRSERPARSDRTPVGIHIGLGTLAVLPSVMAAAMLPVSAGGWRLVPVVAVLALIGAYTVDPVAAAAATAVAYLLVDGFLVNQYGVLRWNGTPDAYRLLVVWVASGAGLAIGFVRLRVHQRRRFMLPREWTAAELASTWGSSLLTDKEEVPGV